VSPLVRLVWVSLVVCSACPRRPRGSRGRPPPFGSTGTSSSGSTVDTGPDHATHDLGPPLMSEGEGPGVVDYLLPRRAARTRVPGADLQGAERQRPEGHRREPRPVGGARCSSPPRSQLVHELTRTRTRSLPSSTRFIPTVPTLATVIDVGTSLQGRHIYGVRITGPGSNTKTPAVQFNGCHPCPRSGISVMVPMWIPRTVRLTRDQFRTATRTSLASCQRRWSSSSSPVVKRRRLRPTTLNATGWLAGRNRPPKWGARANTVASLCGDIWWV